MWHILMPLEPFGKEKHQLNPCASSHFSRILEGARLMRCHVGQSLAHDIFEAFLGADLFVVLLMHLFRLENITIKPLLVIAEDYDHAADIFRHSLVTGLHHRPDADFDVTKWRIKPRHRDKLPWAWVKEGNAGMLWNVDDGAGWELAHTSMVRGLER